MSGLCVIGVKHFGVHTENAATPINSLVPPRRNCHARIKRVNYTPGATSHTLYAMRPLARTTASAAASASQAVVNLTADPGTGTVAGGIAANDWCVLELADGTFQLNKVASVATLAVTFTDNLSAAMVSGARVWFLGAPANGHATFSLPTGSTTTLPADASGSSNMLGTDLAGTDGPDEPLVLHIDNVTNAGTLNSASCVYTMDGAA